MVSMGALVGPNNTLKGERWDSKRCNGLMDHAKTLLQMNISDIQAISRIGEGRAFVQEAMVTKVLGDAALTLYTGFRSIGDIVRRSFAASSTTGFHPFASSIAETNRYMPTVPHTPVAITGREVAVWNAEQAAQRTALTELGTNAAQFGATAAAATVSDYFADFEGTAVEMDNAFGRIAGHVTSRDAKIDSLLRDFNEHCK